MYFVYHEIKYLKHLYFQIMQYMAGKDATLINWYYTEHHVPKPYTNQQCHVIHCPQWKCNLFTYLARVLRPTLRIKVFIEILLL